MHLPVEHHVGKEEGILCSAPCRQGNNSSVRGRGHDAGKDLLPHLSGCLPRGLQQLSAGRGAHAGCCCSPPAPDWLPGPYEQRARASCRVVGGLSDISLACEPPDLLGQIEHTQLNTGRNCHTSTASPAVQVLQETAWLSSGAALCCTRPSEPQLEGATAVPWGWPATHIVAEHLPVALEVVSSGGHMCQPLIQESCLLQHWHSLSQCVPQGFWPGKKRSGS